MTRTPMTEENDKPLIDYYELGLWWIWGGAVVIFLIFVLGLYYISPNVAYLKGTP